MNELNAPYKGLAVVFRSPIVPLPPAVIPTIPLASDVSTSVMEGVVPDPELLV
jgi:hypothetical protein